MKEVKIDPGFFAGNRKRFCSLMDPMSLAMFHSNDNMMRNSDQNFRFRQQSDLFYLAGIRQEKTILLLFPDSPNPDLREVLFILESNESIETWEGHKLTKKEAAEISGVKTVRWVEHFETALTEAMVYAENVYLNSIEYIKYFNDVVYRDLRFAQEMRGKWPNHSYKRAAPLVSGLRTVKSSEEIDLIKEAIQITGKAFKRIMQFIKPGVTEYQVQAEIEHEFLFSGAAGSAYLPIVASGVNSCVLHYIENNNECRDGDLLLLDIGAEYGCYAADLTRTIPVNGRFTKRQRECYESVLQVQKKAIKLLVPGNTIDKVNKEVNKLMEKELIRLGLFSEEQVKSQDLEKPLYQKYFMHGASHFLGLDVHDTGSKYEPFRPGMVLTCEPGLYIREESIGIRLENNILITEKGPFDLTAEIPIDPDDIEKGMK